MLSLLIAASDHRVGQPLSLHLPPLLQASSLPTETTSRNLALFSPAFIFLSPLLVKTKDIRLPDFKEQDIQKQLWLWGKVESRWEYPWKGSEKTRENLKFVPQSDPQYRDSLPVKTKTKKWQIWGRGWGQGSDFQSYHIIIVKCPVFNNKNSQNMQRNRKVWLIERKEKNNNNKPMERPDGGFIRQKLWNDSLRNAQKTKVSQGESELNCMYKMEISIKRKPKKKPKGNSRAKKYINWNAKFPRRVQRHIWAGRRINKFKGRTIEIIESM